MDRRTTCRKEPASAPVAAGMPRVDPIWRRAAHRLHDWLRDRVRAARLRAQAERALPRAVRWRRDLRQGALQLTAGYVLLNLAIVPCVPFAIPTTLECHIVDDATGAPIANALVHAGEIGWEERSDPTGRATLVMRTTPSLLWALPSFGSYRLGGLLQVAAPDYRPAEVALPATFDWPLFDSPRAVVHVRLTR